MVGAITAQIVCSNFLQFHAPVRAFFALSIDCNKLHETVASGPDGSAYYFLSLNFGSQTVSFIAFPALVHGMLTHVLGGGGILVILLWRCGLRCVWQQAGVILFRECCFRRENSPSSAATPDNPYPLIKGVEVHH